MNLKILIGLLFYYTLLVLVFSQSNDIFNDAGYNNTIELSADELGANETDTGGLFGSGVEFGRWFTFIGFGVGLPDSVPLLFRTLFIAFQVIMNIFTIGWIISSIWNG